MLFISKRRSNFAAKIRLIYVIAKIKFCFTVFFMFGREFYSHLCRKIDNHFKSEYYVF
jgi:hypothetical protein